MSTGLAAKTGADVFGTISVAMVTPFTTTNNVDLDKATQLARHLVDHGVDSLVLAGTTGESPTTTLSEKLDLLTAVRREVGDSIKIIAGAGTNNTATSVELARASAQAGADALLVVTPYYSKPSQEGLYHHFATVAQATDLPVCLYDIPPRSVVPIAADTMRRLAELPTIQAVKDAKGNIAEATALIAETGLAWYSGDDPLNLPWLSVGATGFISVIGHLAPAQLVQLHQSFNNGDLAQARKINASLNPLVAAQGKLGGVTMAKAGLKLQGLDMGTPRLPVMAATTEEIEALRYNMEKSGVL